MCQSTLVKRNSFKYVSTKWVMKLSVCSQTRTKGIQVVRIQPTKPSLPGCVMLELTQAAQHWNQPFLATVNSPDPHRKSSHQNNCQDSQEASSENLQNIGSISWPPQEITKRPPRRDRLAPLRNAWLSTQCSVAFENTDQILDQNQGNVHQHKRKKGLILLWRIGASRISNHFRRTVYASHSTSR